MDPSLKYERVFNPIPLNLLLSGWIFALAVVLALSPHFPRAEHFAGVFQRGIGDVVSAGHAG
jgi:hypothetical protein